MIFTILLTILLLSAILGGVCQYCHDKGGETYTNFVLGFMFGVLKNEELQELYDTATDETINYQTEHTLQICIGFVSFTFVWIEEENN